jgi:DNA-binding LytR/AlgR family response regulator
LKTVVHTWDRNVETAVLVKNIIDSLSRDLFVRIYKQYFVNVSHILKVSHMVSGRHKVFLRDEDDTELPVGRAFLRNLREKI